ncbi:MAG: phosphotransacetylase, partial [Deltaproteobacteria bacterium]|nr:phosphotransacetylase [Deltaproteobacteria bacterium]
PLINPSSVVMRKVINQAKTNPKKIVFPEGEQPKVLRACQRLVDEGIAHPVLLGREERIKKVMKQEEIELENVEIIDPYYSKHYGEFVNEFQKKRARRGVTKSVARLEMQSPINFGLMMVSKGLADGFVSGLTMGYAESMRPALRLIGTAGGIKRACGVYLVILKNDMKFFADTTVNIDPNAEELLEIALTTARFVASFGITPKIAMLSFANFGSSPCPQTEKVKQATAMIKAEHPDIVVDGEIQVDLAVDPDLVEEVYPFCAIKGDANVFIFPDLSSGNIGYKLMGRLGGATVIGPILLGMAKPINILQHGADVESIINLTAFTVVRAQNP